MAEIVYQGPDEVLTVECEDVNHIDEGDVWRVVVGENDAGEAIHREIPRERVYYLEWEEGEADSFLRHWDAGTSARTAAARTLLPVADKLGD